MMHSQAEFDRSKVCCADYRCAVELWPITVAARRSLLADFERLDDEQWEAQSLCAGWSIREILGHLVLAARPPAWRYAVAIARAKGSFDEANRSLAVAEGRRPVHELLSAYRQVLDHRFSPAGWPAAAPLSDIMLHSLDVRIPLGLATDQPAEHYAPVMSLLFVGRVGRSFTTSGRPQVRWNATDHEWSHGAGPLVCGTLADLALTAAGRAARIGSLTGEGVDAVRSWLR